MQDVADVRQQLGTDYNGLTLWCMGVPKKRLGKRGHDTESDSEISECDDFPRRVRKKKKKTKSWSEEKQERIDDLIDELKAKHGVRYNDIQYRIWAESLDTHYHKSLGSASSSINVQVTRCATYTILN